MTVPFDVDAETANVEFKNGVLTVTIAKPDEMIKNTKKIEIKQVA